MGYLGQSVRGNCSINRMTAISVDNEVCDGSSAFHNSTI